MKKIMVFISLFFTSILITTAEAIFEPENPNTADIILITFATLLISGITLTYTNYKKTKLR